MGSGKGEPDYLYPKDPGHDVHQKDAFKFFTRFTNDAMTATLQMAFAGVWDRFPKLQFYWAETMVGWLEYGLWQIDDHYRRYIGMIHDNWGLNKLDAQTERVFEGPQLLGLPARSGRRPTPRLHRLRQNHVGHRLRPRRKRVPQLTKASGGRLSQACRKTKSAR